MNSQIATAGSQGNVGIGFAVPSNTVRQVVPRLKRGQTVVRPGSACRPAPRSAAGRASSRSVSPGGPAAKAGLRATQASTGAAATSSSRSTASRHRPRRRLAPHRGPAPRATACAVDVERDGKSRSRDVTLGTPPEPDPHAVPARRLLRRAAVPAGAARGPGRRRALRARRAAAGPAGRAAFAAPALLPSVAPRPPGWRRHVPLAFYALALAALALALARPQATRAVAVEQARGRAGLRPVRGRWRATDVAAQPPRGRAARRRPVPARVPKKVRVGAVAFNHAPRVVQGPTVDRQGVRDALDAVQPAGRHRHRRRARPGAAHGAPPRAARREGAARRRSSS